LALAAALVAPAGAVAPDVATADLMMSDGTLVGTATFTGMDGGTQVTVDAFNMPPGDHGIHIHMTGLCDGPDFASAGGHLNPTGMQHGLDNPQGPHAGDFPNLTVADDGTGTLDYMSPATMDEIFDADGSALVVHANPDDEMTDPAGNSGPRIACGVITAVNGAAEVAAPTEEAAPTAEAAPTEEAMPTEAAMPTTEPAMPAAPTPIPAAPTAMSTAMPAAPTTMPAAPTTMPAGAGVSAGRGQMPGAQMPASQMPGGK